MVPGVFICNLTSTRDTFSGARGIFPCSITEFFRLSRLLVRPTRSYKFLGSRVISCREYPLTRHVCKKSITTHGEKSMYAYVSVIGDKKVKRERERVREEKVMRWSHVCKAVDKLRHPMPFSLRYRFVKPCDTLMST